MSRNYVRNSFTCFKFLNQFMIISVADALNQPAGPSLVKQKHPLKQAMSSSLDATTSANPKKTPVENLQLAECIGDVRALLIDILCDEIALSADNEGYEATMEILDECHTTFLSCFNAFYPTNTLKWNCLCDLLMKKDKGVMHARLLSAILAGLCNPNVKLKSTFPLLSSTRESMVSRRDSFSNHPHSISCFVNFSRSSARVTMLAYQCCQAPKTINTRCWWSR